MVTQYPHGFLLPSLSSLPSSFLPLLPSFLAGESVARLLVNAHDAVMVFKSETNMYCLYGYVFISVVVYDTGGRL